LRRFPSDAVFFSPCPGIFGIPGARLFSWS